MNDEQFTHVGLLQPHVVAILMGSSRVSWLVDDGSGVIDCIQRHPHQAAMTNNSPKKTVVRFSGKASAVTAIHSGSPIKQSRVPLAGLHTEVPCPPKPVASIGSAVGVIGRVVVRGEGRVVPESSSMHVTK